MQAAPATDDLSVLAVPRLSKSFTDDPVNAGDIVNLEFTLTYDEFASGDATNVSFDVYAPVLLQRKQINKRVTRPSFLFVNE